MPNEEEATVVTPTVEEVIADETAKIEEEPKTEAPIVEEPTEPTEEPAKVEEEPYIEETPAVVQDLPADVKTFVEEKLPDVEVWGRDGQDGKVQKFSVKSAFDLPDDFVPRSYKDQQIQAQQFAKQDRLTSNLETEYAKTQEDNAKAETQAQLEASWAIELQGAQASGRIPKVEKEAPGDAGFDKAAEVIDYMRKANEQLATINAPYRVQSFTQALDLYEANASKVAEADKTTKEEALTSKRGSMVGSGRGTKDQFKDLPKPGTKLEDILAEYAT